MGSEIDQDAVDWERKQDALDWLQTAAETRPCPPEAKTLLVMVEASESRENTVIGMCMARRPHDEIRDFLLGAQS